MAITVQAQAESVEAFYRGKTISVLIPSAPGGGYDRYGRLVARHMGERVPGKPTLVPRNIPGAGGVIEANQLYTASPKDGTVIGIIQHNIPFRPIFDPRQVRYKVEGFRWLGSVTPITNTAIVNKSSGIASVGDLFTKELIVGSSGGTTTYLPSTVNSVLGTKIKLISGYKNTTDILLAMERREVEGLVGIGLTSLRGSKAAKDVDYKILFQMAYKKHPDLLDVPLVQDHAKKPDDKAVMEAIFASFSIGRSFVTLDIPEDRLAALRAAFKEMMMDPKFIEEARKSKAEVSYVSPEEIQDIIKMVYGLPKPILERAAKAFTGG
jgi:tripartite-type tricarboxylate transporter receptor subunit TctC